MKQLMGILKTRREPSSWEEAHRPADGFAMCTVRSEFGSHFGPWVGRVAEFMLAGILAELQPEDRPLVTVFYEGGEDRIRKAYGQVSHVGDGDLVFADGALVELDRIVSFAL